VNPAIHVAALSKRYQIGQRDPSDSTFRELIVNTVRAPFRRFRQLTGQDGDGWFFALRDIAFDVQQGEVVAVIGRNGAGKSTLLKVLSRITDPTAGRVEMRGRVASLLEVGTGFHPDLTGRENVFLNGAILGMRRAEIRRKFDAIVEFAEVSRFIDTAVKHYSSGMYLRLAFAVAAHLDGEILLVDEVLAVGDVAFQQKCLGKIQDVSRGGRTVIFVTHNMSAASTLCDRGILIEGGRVKVDAGIQDTIKAYLGELATGGQSWDVGDTPRTWGRGELLRFMRIEAHPPAPAGFRYLDPLRFRFRVRAHGSVPALFIGVGIDDLLGHRVATFDSNVVDFNFATEGGGDYSFELVIPKAFLNPGRYFLSVSLFSGQIFYDVLIHAASFDIAPIHADTGEYFQPIAGAGAMSVPYEWIELSPSRQD
jgi:lipopolysaccharide transport system ATP-binding protein